MIEFCGELSDECKKYTLKDETKIKLFAFSIVAVVFSIPIIIATIVWNWLFVIALPALILFVILADMPATKKAYGLVFPARISIEENTIESESERFYYSKSISQVKNVIDWGDWYHIHFYFPHKNRCFICQKNLITKGSIEEFEKLFEGKIERNKTKLK